MEAAALLPLADARARARCSTLSLGQVLWALERSTFRMILMAQKELELITPAQYQSIDMGDLKDQEIRALLYKLVVQHPNLISTSADAQREVQAATTHRPR